MIADIIAEDREGRPVLLVEVKAAVRDTSVRRLLTDLSEAPDTITYGMLVEPETIRVFRRGSATPLAEFSTTEVLGHYSPGYVGAKIRDMHERLLDVHIRTLVEAWLRDLAYHWKPGEPPQTRGLEQIGLLPLIQDGSTNSEVRIVGHSLR